MTTDQFIEEMRVTVEHRVADAVSAERERCAKIALEQGKHYGESAIGSAIANAIRATGAA